MAAKQGLTAQLSQAGEDARRVLQGVGGTSGSSIPRSLHSRGLSGGSAVGAPTAPSNTQGSSSNANTVCTIKSAPARSPHVLEMLATQSGWLYKRNEQHVWQARWCCVVPHTFLYYFDTTIDTTGNSSSTGGSSIPMLKPSFQQQEQWNTAIETGYGNRKKHEKRSALYLFQNHNSTTTTATENGPASSSSPSSNNAMDSSKNSHHETTTTTASAVAASAAAALVNQFGGGGGGSGSNHVSIQEQPAGIIDLECYTALHRCSTNPMLLELAGDDTVNPDLRSFYFCADSEAGVQDWTQALLQDRHASLQDECDAYKQVCDGFCQQLQTLHTALDEAQASQSQAQDEVYRVRSQAEEVRRSCWRIIEEELFAVVEQRRQEETGSHPTDPSLVSRQPSQEQDDAAPVSSDKKGGDEKVTVSTLAQKKSDFLLQLERVRSQDMGVPAALQLLCQYTDGQHEALLAVMKERDALGADLVTSGQSDQAKVQELEAELQALRDEMASEKQQYQSQVETSQTRLTEAQKELHDVQKELHSTRMEFTMYQSQQKTRMGELQNHKKILKKEVIDLRSQLEDVQSELAVLKHQQSSHALRAEQERTKADLLERYVEKMESQVKVQQNMMEMMSQGGSVYGGGGSVYGGGGGSVVLDRPSPQHRPVHGDELDDNDEEDMEDEVDERMKDRRVSQKKLAAPRRFTSGRGRHSLVDNDLDNKSHVSELTEDRTQRHFEAFSREQHQHLQQYTYHEYSQRRNTLKPPQEAPAPVDVLGPPSYIGVGGGGGADAASPSSENDKARTRHRSSRNQGVSDASSLPATMANSSTPPARRSDIPRSSASRHNQYANYSDNFTSDGRFSPEQQQRLSVAQRARLEADRQSTPVKARLDEKSALEIEKKKSSPMRLQLPQKGPQDAGRMDSGASQGSGLWRRMEEAVLGPRPDDELSSEDDSEDCSSVRSTRVTDYTDDGAEGDASPRATVKARRKSTDREVTEEKKSGDDVSISNLSLQERSQLQRAKQLRFLKDHGLIKEEADVRGGAGASPGLGDTASVSSSNVSQPRTSVSAPGSRRSPRSKSSHRFV